jgi:hypothetical protein
MRHLLLLSVFAAAAALAQVPTFDAAASEAVQQARVQAVVTGGRVFLFSDGGCAVQAEISVGSVVVQPQVRKARPAVCAAAFSTFAAAARLDLGVVDGGTP